MNKQITFLSASFLLAACTGGGSSTTSATVASDTNVTSITGTDTNGTDSAGTDSSTGSTSTTQGSASDSATTTGMTTGMTTGSTTSATDATSATGSTSSTTTDSGSTSGSTSSTGGGSTTGIVPCQVEETMLQPIPPNIVLVLDKSGSMVSNSWDDDNNGGTPDVTRWSSLYKTVKFITETFENQINFGSLLFPSTQATNALDQNACVVSGNPEIAVGPANAAAILGSIPPENATNVQIKGGTPAARSIANAQTHLEAQPAANPRAIIFVTDGAANCQLGTSWPQVFNQYDQTLHTNVQAAAAASIPTYVVGIDIENMMSDATQDGSPDNTNPYTKLNELANDGGTPKGGAEDFYQTTNQIELQAALTDIVDNALSCIVPLDPEPDDPDLFQVKVNNMLVPKVVDCANEDGWVYTNPNGPYDEIELCGTWCAELKMTGSLQAEYFCKPG